MAFMDEPTFTLNEFVYSWVPGVHWVPRDLEALGYFTGKLSVGILPIAARAAYLYQFGNIPAAVVAQHGSRWAAAGSIAMDTVSGYRFASMVARVGRFVTHPLGAAVLLAYSLPPSGKTWDDVMASNPQWSVNPFTGESNPHHA